MSRKAYFTGESYLGSTAKISPFDSFEGGLNFRTLQPSGLLFYHSDGVCTNLCLDTYGEKFYNILESDIMQYSSCNFKALKVQCVTFRRIYNII